MRCTFFWGRGGGRKRSNLGVRRRTVTGTKQPVAERGSSLREVVAV